MQIQNPMMFVRSIKGAPASVLFAFMLTRQAMTVKQLCPYTDYKPDAIREALEVLAGYGLVRESKLAHGESLYALAEGYEVLLPGINPRALARVEEAAGVEAAYEPDVEEDAELILDSDAADAIQNPKKSDSGAAHEIAFSVQNPKKSDSGVAHEIAFSVQNPKKSDSGAKKEGSIMIDDDEPKNLENNHHHHQSEPDFAQISARAVLENLHLVFGGTLDLDEIPRGTTGPQILAWVCKINADLRNGGKIHNPLGLLRARLSSGKRRRILHLDLLPGEFLEALGLTKRYSAYSEEAVQIAIEEARKQVEQVEKQAELLEHQFERLQSLVPTSEREIWSRYRARLQENLSRAAWDNWCKDAVLILWGGQPHIAARNDYAARWMSSHLEDIPFPVISQDSVANSL